MAKLVASMMGGDAVADVPAAVLQAADSPGIPRPLREPFPQGSDILRGEPEKGECLIAHPVQPQPGVSQIAAVKAGIEPTGEAD